MPRDFQIPSTYRSEKISTLKTIRRELDSRKRDFEPTVFSFANVDIALARFFGFCFGVENAIERAYQAVEENPNKRVFLLSEMIHNPFVNQNLQARGVRFLQSTEGKSFISLSELTPEDIVIVPAFGTTVELFRELEERGIPFQSYDTTCPFVEKVWKRSNQLGSLGFTVVIHGKHEHEETRATFSHASTNAPSIVVRDKKEAQQLIDCIRGTVSSEDIVSRFSERMTPGFDPQKDLERIGVVNQTTMLASETHEISLMFRAAFLEKYCEEGLRGHFADTRDTLCYATNENQTAAQALAASGGDLALVVGGYNSSNTSHLVELLEKSCPTYFIRDAEEIEDESLIRHLDIHLWEVRSTRAWFKKKSPKLRVLVTAGASCPDAVVEGVIQKVLQMSGDLEQYDQVFERTLERLRVNVGHPSGSLPVLGQG